MKSSKRNIYLISGFVLILLSVATLMLLLNSQTRNQQSNSSNSIEQQVEETQNNDQQKPSEVETKNENNDNSTKTYVGNSIIATIPNNWSIVEYSTKEGMSAFADTGTVQFSGLTGLEVKDENNAVVFSLKGIDGIGGAGGCTTLTKFSDTEQSYIDNIKTETSVLGFGQTNVIDVSQSNYTEFELLGLRFRRIDNNLYVAKNYSMAFNTSCGIEAQFIKIDEISFTINDSGNSYSANAYKFTIPSSVVDTQKLNKLDGVLESIVAKNIS